METPMLIVDYPSFKAGFYIKAIKAILFISLVFWYLFTDFSLVLTKEKNLFEHIALGIIALTFAEIMITNFQEKLYGISSLTLKIKRVGSNFHKRLYFIISLVGDILFILSLYFLCSCKNLTLLNFAGLLFIIWYFAKWIGESVAESFYCFAGDSKKYPNYRN